MKISIDATPKEIADLVLEIQNRQSAAIQSPVDTMSEVLFQASRDTDVKER